MKLSTSRLSFRVPSRHSPGVINDLEEYVRVGNFWVRIHGFLDENTITSTTTNIIITRRRRMRLKMLTNISAHVLRTS